MAEVVPIQVGDEVKLRGLKNQPVAVVTLNEAEKFCTINKRGETTNCSRATANPIKTGKHYEGTLDFLLSLG